jgi:hypothetical protein
MQYRFTIDTYEDQIHFTKASRSPPMRGELSIYDSSHDLHALSKNLNVVSQSNINIQDGMPNYEGKQHVHFTPKEPQANTILGFYEGAIDINRQQNMGLSKQRLSKLD